MFRFEEIDNIISDVQCEPWKFRFGCLQCLRTAAAPKPCDDVSHTWFLQVRLLREDIETHEQGWGAGGKYFVNRHMTQGEIVKKCFVAVRDYAEHEVRESFKFRGHRILGPHISIEALMEASTKLEVRD